MSLDDADLDGDLERDFAAEAPFVDEEPRVVVAPPPRVVSGPMVDPVACSGCGKLIDPLRAGHVAIFDLRFHFFCNFNVCRAVFLGDAPAAPAPSPAPRTPVREEGLGLSLDQLSNAILPAYAPAQDLDLPDVPAHGEDRALVEPIAQTILSEEPPFHDPNEQRDIGALLLVMAIVAGSLAVSLTLAGEARLVVVSRIILAAVGVGMLLGRAATTVRDACDPHPGPVLGSSTLSLAVAIWATLGKDRALGAEAASLAGILVTAAAVSAWLAESARRQVNAERAWIENALAVPGRRVVGEGELEAEDSNDRDHDHDRDRGGDRRAAKPAAAPKEKVFDLRSGEQIVVETGEVVPVDVVLTGGDVEVLPWIGATTPARRRTGDPVVAGARVVRGRLRGICTWAGHDRAFARMLVDPRRRADTLAPIAQASLALAERWAIVAAAIGAVAAAVAHRNAIEIAMTTVAVHAALATSVIASIAATHVARGILLGLRRGIVYKSADAWDRAGRVAVAVFSARGTILLGEPELAELESVANASRGSAFASATGKLDPSQILAFAAGAERSESHPIAAAIVRAARTRGLRPDGVRNPNTDAGMGVTAVSSSGEELCVGSRSLMMDRRISIASAETRIAELESLGRTVVLVALGSRLVGLLGLQDGLRPGARAAVQHLLDAQIEPVLMSGDSRETCEAIGRSLDIDHIRPEVLPAGRASEVRSLIESGLSVAVLGHAGVDEAALGAADVAVALAAAGSTPGDFAITLASDDVRDAALALALAHRARNEARLGLALAAVPALIGATAIAFGLLPPAFAPIASLLGGAMAVAHVKRTT
jgi:Cu+-exporting ATPase